MEFDWLDVVLRILSGAIVGFCIGMTGVGGGAIAVPLLTIGFGMPPSISVGTASLYTFLTKIYATYRHFRLKTINYRVAWTFLAGAVPGNVIASWYVNYRAGSNMDEGMKAQFQGNLKAFIAMAMLASVGMLFLNLVKRKKKGGDSRSELGRNPGRASQRHPGKMAIGLLMGAVVGAVVGATALGAGVMAIPVLLLCFGITASQCIGSSIFIGLILTLISSLIYTKGGQMHTMTAVLMSLGSLGGVYYGSKMTVKLPEARLKQVVIGIILIASVLMFFR